MCFIGGKDRHLSASEMLPALLVHFTHLPCPKKQGCLVVRHQSCLGSEPGRGDFLVPARWAVPYPLSSQWSC